MSVDLSSISCLNKINQGGVKRLQAIRAEDVVALQEVCSGSYDTYSPETLESGKAWTSYYFEPDTVQYSFTPQVTPHGTHYDLAVKGFNAIIRPEIVEEINKLKDGYYLIKIEDYNGYHYLIGTQLSPARFTGSGDTQPDRGGENGSQWTFQAKSRYPGTHLPPPDLCADLAANPDKWLVQEIQLHDYLTGEFAYVELTPHSNSGISGVVSYPDGSIYDAQNTLMGTIEWNATNQRYETHSQWGGPIYLSPSGDYRVHIPGISVYMQGGGVCATEFDVTYAVTLQADTTPPSALIKSPQNGQQDVYTTHTISLTFSESIQRGSGTIKLRRYWDDVVIHSWDVTDTVNVTLGGSDKIVTFLGASPQRSHSYYMEVPSTAFSDLVGLPFGGIGKTFNPWIWSTATLFAYSPNPGTGSIDNPLGLDPYLEFSQATTLNSGNFTLHDYDSDTILKTYVAPNDTDLSMVGNRLFFLNAPLVDGGRYYIISDNDVINDPIQTDAIIPAISPKTAWEWTMATDNVAPTISTLTPSDDSSGVVITAPLIIEMDEAVKLAASGNITIHKTSDDSVIETLDITDSNQVAYDYQGNNHQVGLIPASSLPSNTSIYVLIPAGVILDLNDNAFAGFLVKTDWNFSTEAFPATVDAEAFTVVINDSSCNGQFSVLVELDDNAQPSPTVTKSATYNQDTFLQGDSSTFLEGVLPGTYGLRLTSTDCVGDVIDYTQITIDVEPNPTLTLEYVAPNQIVGTIADIPSYCLGVYTWGIDIQDDQLAFIAQYNGAQSDFPPSWDLSGLGLVVGDTYSATLSVITCNVQASNISISFQYSDPCAAITFPDLSTNIIGWTDQDPDIRVDFVGSGGGGGTSAELLDLQARFPSEVNQILYDRYHKHLISTFPTLNDFLTLINGAGLLTEFEFPVTKWRSWILTYKERGNINSERRRILPQTNGDIFLWLQDGYYDVTIWQLGFPPTVVTTIDFSDRLSTTTTKTMDALRSHPTDPNIITYPKAHELWGVKIIYDSQTETRDVLLATFPVANGILGDTNNRRIGGGDGNGNDPYTIITQGGRDTNAVVFDVTASEEIYDEQVGNLWVERRVAIGDAPRRTHIPGTDYAFVSPSGKYVIAAVDGSGTLILDRSWNIIGQVHHRANHCDAAWLQVNGVYEECFFAYAGGNGSYGSNPKDGLAITFSVSIDGDGNRTLNTAVYTILDWHNNAAGDGGGQLSARSDEKDYMTLSQHRSDFGTTDAGPYIDSQIVILTDASRTYKAQLIGQNYTIDNPSASDQPEGETYKNWTWFRTKPGSGENKKAILIYRPDPATDAEIQAAVDVIEA